MCYPGDDGSSDHIRSMINLDLRSNTYTDNHMGICDKIRLKSILETIRATDAQIIMLPTTLGRIIKDVKEMGKKAVVDDGGGFIPHIQNYASSCAIDLVYGDAIVHADLILGVSEWHRNNIGMFVDNHRHMQILPSDPVTTNTVKLVSPARYMAPHFPKDHKVRLKKIRYVHVSFIGNAGSSITKESLGIPDKSFVFVSSGRLEYVKRVDVTLAAYADFLAGADNKYSDTMLLVLGDGAEYSNLKRHAKDAGISDHVMFAGRVKTPQPYLGISDVFITTTDRESFGRSIGEASMEGIPVIAPRTSAIPEVVMDGRTGLLYEPGNIRDVVRCMRKLYGSPAMRKEMGAAGKEFISKNFTPKAMGRRLLDLYAECGLLDGMKDA